MNKLTTPITLLLLFMVTQVTAQKNILKNGDFEDDLAGWNGDVAVISPWVVKSGKSSCAITRFNNTQWAGMDQMAYLPKKAVAIEFSVWVKASVQPGKDPWNTGLVNVEFLGGGNNKIGDGESIATLTGNTDWTLYKKTLIVPKGAKSLRVLLALSSASGSMVIDDVVARPVTQEEQDQLAAAAASASEAALAMLKNGDFEKGTEGWSGTAGTISTTAHSGSNSYAITTTSAADWAGIDQLFPLLNTTTALEASVWIKSVNLLQGKDPWNGGTMIVEFSADGKKVGEATTIAVVTGTQDWKLYTGKVPVPAGAKHVRVMLAMSFATGTFFIDDVALNQVK